MTVLEFLAVFLTGAAGYGSLELLWRGWTHWSMLLAGGICTLVMYWIANFSGLPLWQEWLLSAGAITAIEFCFGLVVNLQLGWGIWDYGRQPLNLLGQICPAFSLAWLGISVPGIWLCRLLRNLVS